MELGNIEMFLCGGRQCSCSILIYSLLSSAQAGTIQSKWFICIYNDFFRCYTRWNNKSKSERVTSADPDPFSRVCVVFFCKPWGLMTLQREEIIPGPVSCFSPSWTICWHFWSWWLPFEPCGGYLKAQPCEVTSEGVTVCLLEVARRDFTFSDLTWQMLRNENSSLAGCEFSTFTGVLDYFSFLAMHPSLFDGNCSITGCFPLDYSLLMPDWLANFLPNPGSETHVWSNSKESQTDLLILVIRLLFTAGQLMD